MTTLLAVGIALNLVAGLSVLQSWSAAASESASNDALTRWEAVASSYSSTPVLMARDSGTLPKRVMIPAAGVSSTLVSLGINADGSIEVPRNPDRAGWFRFGPAPGAKGPAVIAGHVDSRTGPAVFYKLNRLRIGSIVSVERRDGTVVRFKVYRSALFSRAKFPTTQVYGPVNNPELRLITCGGRFDRRHGHYADNLVVFARVTA